MMMMTTSAMEMRQSSSNKNNSKNNPFHMSSLESGLLSMSSESSQHSINRSGSSGSNVAGSVMSIGSDVSASDTSRRESLDSCAGSNTSPAHSNSGSSDDCDMSSKSRSDSGNGSNNSNASGQQQRRRKKKKRPAFLDMNLASTRFSDFYVLTGDVLGEGATGRVETCVNMFNDVEYAVKIISKQSWCFSRTKVLKEVELYYLCRGQNEIIQLIEYFEEPDYFYLVFEKVCGGQLLDQIQRRVHFSEQEAASIVRDLAKALKFLHERGIAHRDLKPENILCVNANAPWPVKLCDFDLCSSVHQTVTTPMLQSPVGSAEYMAPEVVNAFATMDNFYDDDDELMYDKRCDLWSLGIITYILLCGYLPFAGHCDDPSCGWESGEECPKCQRSLFDAIRSGSLVFPEQHWSSISKEAKDLISRLLVKEASQRLDAGSLLQHPWIVNGGSPDRMLETPSVLRRQTSVKEFSEFATSALALKRNIETNFTRSMMMQKSATSNDLAGMTGTGESASVGPRSSCLGRIIGLDEAVKRQTSLILLEDEPDDNHHHHAFQRCEL